MTQCGIWGITRHYHESSFEYRQHFLRKRKASSGFFRIP